MLYLISYDLKTPAKNYEPLWQALIDAGAVRVLESQWTLRHNNTTTLAVGKYCAAHMDANDRLLVTEMPENYASMNLIATPKAA